MHPILFKIGSFEVPSFGVAMVVAFLSALRLAQARGPRFGISKPQISDMAFVACAAGVFGARLVFIAQEWRHFAANPGELVSLRFSGLTSFGGLIFGFGTAFLWAKRKGIPARNLLDAMAPAFLLGHLIGRFGCLMNGCCFGGVCPANVPWAIHVHGSMALHHPAQIYDSLMNLAALGAVLLVERGRSLKPGQVTGLALALHGVARFIYEFWRAGTDAQVQAGEASSTYWGKLPITQAQGMAALLILVGVVLFAFAKSRTVTRPSETLPDTQPVA